METANTSTIRDWVLFLIFLVIIIALVIYASEWFWVALPFVLTYLVKAVRAL